MHKLGYATPAAVSPVASAAIDNALRSPDGLLDRLPVAICICDRKGFVVQVNRRANELWERCVEVQLAIPQVGKKLPPALLDSVGDVLTTAVAVRDMEITIEGDDGVKIALLANVDPLFDPKNECIGAMACFQDVTSLSRVRHDSERRSQDVLDALPAAVYTTDAVGRVTFYNKAAAELAGREPELGSDHWCVTWRLYAPDGAPLPHEQCPMAVALKENRPVRGVDALAERPDGTRVPFMPFPTPLHDADGNLIGAVNMLVDITERKQAEERQKALVDELNHRVKNMLATVQALATQTMRGETSTKIMCEKFSARLLALSKAHDQLTRWRWQLADLKAMIEDVLAPFQAMLPGGAEPRIMLTGGSVDISPKAALTLAMVLHELATNAVKYGALSNATGQVALSWQEVVADAQRRLRIDWVESGGPPVVAPARQGFGTRLVERGFTHELNGAATLDFASPGLRCAIEIPLSAAP